MASDSASIPFESACLLRQALSPDDEPSFGLGEVFTGQIANGGDVSLFEPLLDWVGAPFDVIRSTPRHLRRQRNYRMVNGVVAQCLYRVYYDATLVLWDELVRFEAEIARMEMRFVRAPSVRLSVLAILPAVVFFRASAFKVRTSSVVQERRFRFARSLPRTKRS